MRSGRGTLSCWRVLGAPTIMVGPDRDPCPMGALSGWGNARQRSTGSAVITPSHIVAMEAPLHSVAWCQVLLRTPCSAGVRCVGVARTPHD